MLLPLSLICIATVLLLLYYLSSRQFDYWKIRGVPYVKPWPFVGNYGSFIILREYAPIITQIICKQFPGAPIVGAFYGTEPSLIVQDPQFIKLITTKDFYYFNSREVAEYTEKEKVTQNLFFTYGDKWKVTRQNLTPLFTSAKIKNMFYLIEKCTHLLEEMLDDVTATSPIVDVRSLTARYTMDCIGTCAFGVETNTMKKSDKPNAYTIFGNKIFESSRSRGLKLITRAMWPAVFYALGYRAFPNDIMDFFKKLLTGVFESRQYKPTNRNDFVDLVLNLRQNRFLIGDSMSNLKTGDSKKVQLEVNDDLLTAQCVLFFGAGYETSATTLNFTLYLLAMNQEAQQKVITEIDAYLNQHDGKVSYECVLELPFVVACVEETLRMYPVLGVLTRELIEDYTLPTGVSIDKGIRVHIPIYHLHHHPDFFPDPDTFRPQRFLGKEKEKIKPYTYMPFGEGPRICIGMRFAWMQMIPALVTIFNKFRIEPAGEAPAEMKFDPTVIVIQPIENIRLKFIRRSDKDA